MTRVALQCFLHEVAHFVLHADDRDYKPYYLREFEAEQWSFNTMRASNIPVPKTGGRIARRNVARAILRSKRAGIQIDLRAARFAWGSHAQPWLNHITEAIRRGDNEIYFWHPEIKPVTAGPPPKEPYENLPKE